MASDDARDRVLRASAQVFADAGYARSSMEAIADAAGVSKKTVYQVARTKGELFVLTIEHELESWTQTVRAEIRGAGRADEIVRRLAVQGAELLIRSRLVPHLLSAIAESEFPSWQQAVAPYREAARANIRALLALGVTQGCFRADLPIDDVAPLIHELQMGRALVEACADGPEAVRRRAAALADLILGGIARPATAV